MSYNFLIITLIKNVNNFQIVKFSFSVFISICLIFHQFQPGVAYKSAAYEKKHVMCYVIKTENIKL